MDKIITTTAHMLREGDRLANGSVISALRVGYYAVSVVLTSGDSVTFDYSQRVRVWR